MKTQNDPVVQNLHEWINRPAGQHQRRISEGTASARRIEKRAEQTDEEAQTLKAWRASVIANGLMRRVDTSQLGERDGVSVGGCCNHECNEGRDCPERIDFAGDEPYSTLSLVLSVVIVTALCLLVWYISPELRALVSIIRN